ncbi:glycosyl transferase family 2 [Nonlabens sp. MIC269]|uniref:ABC-F family ATP-binding cassette domain-containing protein n=1 Tax=Nonlabens TaxID=363408 RepID=UPI000722C265|nr:ABC-F family ATP-binding cassette domain-containing protein [Nonlabens sp. MIC269]ALM21825.1 glycosyl transferase family 2 [Nonlabens sp. MIC269]MEE2801031.1 ABC-F family ATP-binding cassette domain-containing protein [Bacteroidota bacterium]
MLNIHNLHVSFGGETLFQEITFRLNAGQRVGLIGKNGAGKSTLLKVVAGDLEYDEGQVAMEKGTSIGFLRQDIDFVQGRTVLEEAYTAFAKAIQIEAQLENINEQLATRTDYESEGYNQLMIDLSDLTHEYEIIGGYHYKGETEKILKGLGFQPEQFNKLTDELSGGWRMRIELAKLLLENHDILLLDEPTNHLDIESILWLEQFLQNYPGAVMIVSHDKMFLDNVTNRTIEISLGRIYDYPKPYTKFLELRAEIREQQEATFKNQQKEIERTEKLIEKFRAKASKATMAQSLIKKLDRMDVVEIEQEDNAAMNIRFAASVQPGKVVLELEDVSKNYGAKTVLRNVNLLLERGKRVAFVGQNGMGKSTLAKIIVGDINDAQGNVNLGHNVQLGYFAQNQAEYLDGEKTILDTMLDAADDTNRVKVRDMLGSFLFRGDEVEKKVKVLSGGERNRLALCKLLLQPFNVLIMDEPTNHLDIQSKNVLKKALLNYDGTLIVVSHDREFLQGLTELVYEFRDHKLQVHLGDIDYYLEQRKAMDMREIEKVSKDSKNDKEVSGTLSRKQEESQPEKKLSYEDQKKLKSLNNRLSKAESNINRLEKEIKEIDLELQVNYDQTVADPKFFDSYQALKTELKDWNQKWESLYEEIESFS